MTSTATGAIARTHSVHDPVDRKYHHVGGYALNGTLPPNHAQL